MVLFNRLRAALNYIFERHISPVMSHAQLQKKFGLFAENRPTIMYMLLALEE